MHNETFSEVLEQLEQIEIAPPGTLEDALKYFEGVCFTMSRCQFLYVSISLSLLFVGISIHVTGFSYHFVLVLVVFSVLLLLFVGGSFTASRC